MRIGILKQYIDNALEDNENIEIKLRGSPIYNGQAYKIAGFRNKQILIEKFFELNILDSKLFTEEIESIVKKDVVDEEIIVTVAEYNRISNLFSTINSILPVIYNVTNYFTPEQDEQVINIKLPNNINNLRDLSKINEKLEDFFKKVGLNGKNTPRICGFDTGSEWYQIIIDDFEAFKWVVVVIGIAWSCIKIRKEWLDTEIARLTLKALKEEPESKNSKADNTIKKILHVKIHEDVESALDNGLNLRGKTKEESLTQLVSAVDSAIQRIDDGIEFHLSLNPPTNIKEIAINGEIQIDYSQVYELDLKNESEVKNIPPET